MGVALNVTDDPGQNGFDDAAMVMLTGRFRSTDTGYWMLDAGLFVVHVAEDVSKQLTRSPLAGM
jgi:hypothetical protein